MDHVASLPLQDSVVVIIGGTAGLGLSAATACVRAGAKVIALGLDEKSVQSAQQVLGAAGRAVVGDARNEEAASGAIELAIREFGRFDALYHVAGGSGRSHGDGPLHEASAAGWNYSLSLNLTSVFYSNRAAAQACLRQGTPGSVLNLGSVLSFAPAPRHFATHAYAAAKAGILGLTRSCAAYYAPHGIRFNMLCAGLVDTDMSRRAQSDAAIMEFVSRKQPLDGGRIGQPADLDAAVVYFLSDQSKFVTGQMLAIDGGWSVESV